MTACELDALGLTRAARIKRERTSQTVRSLLSFGLLAVFVTVVCALSYRGYGV